jgi:hypothetical protein
VLLLGSADHAGDPVGHLSVQLASHAAAATPARMLDDGPTVPVTGTPIAPGPTSDSANDDSGGVVGEGRSPDD